MRLTRWIWLPLALTLAGGARFTFAQEKPNEETATTTTPADWRTRIAPTDFASSGTGSWLSPTIVAPFPFDELIYSWNAALPPREGFRLYLKVTFGPADESPWLYAGYWGDVRDRVTSRSLPRFDAGVLDMDWLKLTRKAAAFRFRVDDAGSAPLSRLPSLAIVATDNSPSTPTLALARALETVPDAQPRILDLPFRRQMDSRGNLTPNRCQSAALATALEYYGLKLPLEEIVARCYDEEYAYPGVWPRVIATASHYGFEAYIDRFRTWDRVRAALAENKVILCSIRMRRGECEQPPYEQMGNHIVALNGVTDDGRVVVTDSFLAKSGRGRQCQWLMRDFEKVWMRAKGGIALVICPPKNAQAKLVTDLPPFPYGREPIRGDDH
ncbi:membrane protein [Candidatus Sumerlaea chitinivorans]|uniref:Membrane protein n=1 Tax=Sumerlaea chitinivorans TaxID=2250252 RepID=A0A2Z4Y7M7_SUMC1|nr:membrane protein [Candidatus Sumerlaea chitinivorans]